MINGKVYQQLQARYSWPRTHRSSASRTEPEETQTEPRSGRSSAGGERSGDLPAGRRGGRDETGLDSGLRAECADAAIHTGRQSVPAYVQLGAMTNGQLRSPSQGKNKDTWE